MNAIPKKWYVLYSNREEFDIISNHFNTYWSYSSDKNCGYSTHPKCRWVGGMITKETLDEQDFKEISFEDFEKYIVNKEPFKQNSSYLKLLLKKLKIK